MKKRKKNFKYTQRHLSFLRKFYPSMSIKELTDAFNARFGADLNVKQLHSYITRKRILSGRTGRFEKGHIPWSLGKKGYMGANATSFKKGDVPPNRKPLYSERIDARDSFILIKVPERDPHTGFPTRYKHKHVWVWEQANGPVPKGHVVMFKDSNQLNCSIDNLVLLKRSELLMVNQHNYKDAPECLKPSILALAKLEAKVGISTCPARGR